MNIDVLANNPPWWLYIPFAVVTTFFTLAVWLIFKYNVDVSLAISSSHHKADLLTMDIVGGKYRSRF